MAESELTPTYAPRNTPGVAWNQNLVPEFTGKNILSIRLHNLIVRALNPLLRITLARGEFDKVIYSAGGITIQLKDFEDTQGGSQPQPGGAPFRFRVVTPTTVPPTTQFNFGDYFICRTWDGITLGPNDIAIAKQWIVRNSIAAENYRGVNKAFAYAYNPADGFKDWTRTTTAANKDPEVSILEPPIIVGDEIWAFDMSNVASRGTGVKDAANNDVVWLDTTPRWWQAVPVDPPV